MTSPHPFLAYDRVRWADVDLVGIMRFSAFTRLLENAEQDLLREAGLPFATMFDHPTVWMPRRHLAIEYFAPARIDDALTLVTYVSRLGDTSITFNVDVRKSHGWTLLASATMVVVCVTADAFQKRPLPTIAREALAPFLCTVEAVRTMVPPVDARSPSGGGS